MAVTLMLPKQSIARVLQHQAYQCADAVLCCAVLCAVPCAVLCAAVMSQLGPELCCAHGGLSAGAARACTGGPSLAPPHSDIPGAAVRGCQRACVSISSHCHLVACSGPQAMPHDFNNQCLEYCSLPAALLLLSLFVLLCAC
jgi:hypothetical protein